MQRLADFIAGIDGAGRRRAWQRCLDAQPSEATRRWNDVLSALPGEAWAMLKASTLQQIDQRDPMRGWSQARDRFNEVHAFFYLQKIGCSDVAFASTSMERRGPDLIATRDDKIIACEVKTLYFKAGSANIARKLSSRLQDAARQLAMMSPDEAYIYLIATGADATTLRAAIDTASLSPCRLVVDCNGAVEALN